MLRLWLLCCSPLPPLLPWRLAAGRCGCEGLARCRDVALVALEELRVRRIHQGGGSMEASGRAAAVVGGASDGAEFFCIWTVVVGMVDSG
jgi:hypothetical protein